MTSYGYSQQPDAARMPGARREKVRGYLRAANELRQTYQSQLQQRLNDEGAPEAMPGTFPDMEIVRNGDEEMVLFPSYARKHVKKHTSSGGSLDRGQPGARDEPDSSQNTGDADYWRAEWERYEDVNAVVDVDVRGWIYSPQKGPLNRRNRLLIAVARRLSGIPAPTPSPNTSRDSSLQPPGQSGSDHTSRHEEEVAAREAENIARHGQKEANAAWRGSYSAAALRDSTPHRGSTSTVGTDTELASEDEDASLKPITKRSSWNEPADMSKEELSKANDLLMARLKPFMTLPLAATTITVFFFNDKKSRSKSVTTNDSGHFNVRAALDFVPTQVRVLASEKLSATENVIITDSAGISLVSDIDDTIKHSAISSGAREIFKNTFIRELGDLTITGVREWYTKLANMGVKMHYVSNSPWQLYPLLSSYFSMAGLPHGSFHLKQYTGMLQGIFEPAAERKKGSLDRIMSDFSERKFILVGDSGEADLEVYTDVVLANPGRILGVFIRDVTTPPKQGFFDQSISNSSRGNLTPKRSADSLRGRSETPGEKPSLPSRPNPDEAMSKQQEQDLIDFSEEPDTTSPDTNRSSSYSSDLHQLDTQRAPSNPPQPPTRPPKPSNLRQFSTTPASPTNHDRHDSNKLADSEVKRPGPPPRPRRSSKSVDMSQTTSSPTSQTQSTSPSNTRPTFSSSRQNQGMSYSGPTNAHPHRPDNPHRSNTSVSPAARPLPPSRTNTSTSFLSSLSSHAEDEGYVASARRQLTSAYNALPALRSSSPARDGYNSDSSGRRGLTSYPAAAARWATGATGGDPAAGGDGGAPPGSSYNKKEEMWKRRWQRAEEIMKSKNVVLRTWREGGDVMDECVRIVERAMKDAETHGRK